MPNPNLLRELNVTEEEIDLETKEALGGESSESLARLFEGSFRSFKVGDIVKGRVLKLMGEDVIVDVGYKSEGLLSLSEFELSAPPAPGKEVEVLLENLDDEAGIITLSFLKAQKIRGWERIVKEKREGDTVRGIVVRKVPGGLLVDVGVTVFLPASQAGVKKATDVGDLIGKEVECKILKIDEQRHSIIVSRRKLLEEERDRMKRQLLSEIAVGETRRGIVKNIADFGAFIDLGGLDGLLHITDMSWVRIGHPSEMLTIGDKMEVKVLAIDREREKVSLGLKQKTPSPWDSVEERYPVNSRVKGAVTNVVNYGSFVRLEPGIEGLVHISEMSWTKRITHPSEMIKIGDEVEVVVLQIDKQKQEISLGMKQAEENPWNKVAERYPAGTNVSGKVRNLASYGAFIEIEEGIDGLVHISDMSWTRKVNNAAEMLKKGDDVEAVILSVDQAKKRISLGMKQLVADPWKEEIPSRFAAATVCEGKVTKATNFGTFVELAAGLEGLLHSSELPAGTAEGYLQPGDVVEVRVIRLDPAERKIGLGLNSVKERVPRPPGPPAAPVEEAPPAQEPTADSPPAFEDGSPGEPAPPA